MSKSFIYYLCYSSVFIAVVLLAVLSTVPLEQTFIKVIAYTLLAGSLVTAWSFFIERNWIRFNEINLDKGWNSRVVVISDQHLGVYKDHKYMERVVAKINTLENIDAVLIPGDLTYYPKDLKKEHSSLADIKFPTYVVLGNHDVLPPDYDSPEKELVSVLENLEINNIENKIISAAKGLTIVGLGDHWAGKDQTDILKNIDNTKKNIILAHNPDTVLLEYPEIDLSNVVTVSGHTHCGQIRIPWLYKKVIPTEGYFPNQGPYDFKEKGTLVITCGLGEVGLPLRLFNRPEILLLSL